MKFQLNVLFDLFKKKYFKLIFIFFLYLFTIILYVNNSYEEIGKDIILNLNGLLSNEFSFLFTLFDIFYFTLMVYIMYSYYSYEEKNSLEFVILRKSYLKIFINKFIILFVISLIFNIILYFLILFAINFTYLHIFSLFSFVIIVKSILFVGVSFIIFFLK